MQCPVCHIDLMMADRQGIEIDYCPKCRGIWLDRGELDKLIERSASAQPQYHRGDYREEHTNHAPPVCREEHQQHRGHYKHKKKSFLSDIFDFD